MENRGICENCINDPDCSYDRRFPISSCDEFQDISCQPDEQA